MYQFSIIKHHTFLGIYKWTRNVFFFEATLLDLSLLPHFLKAIFAKFSGRGVLLGESQLYKVLLLLIPQVEFDDD